MFASFFEKMLRSFVRYSREVRHALDHGLPVVALESTIISHGMPYPENLKTAVDVENDVRENGATPATIALMDGNLHVGLDDDLLERLAKDGASAVKCSRRDMARVLASKRLGATTVSGTMIAAHLAGIEVFVTGGIGGVHRGVEETLDISADLSELGRTPVTVVCAGVKSILDIPRTLEYLETQGVAVMCWKTDAFPAFFTVDSGEDAPIRVDSEVEVANWIRANGALGLSSGAVVAVPNPQPAKKDVIDSALSTALAEVRDKGIGGKSATPYLLSRMNELTRGESLRSNIALVRNNAAIGARIAVARASHGSTRLFSTVAPRALIAGGATMDVISTGSSGVQIGTSNVGVVQQSHGGVGRNVCEVIGRLTAGVENARKPAFLSVVGGDAAGRAIADTLAASNVDISSVSVSKGRTGVYSSILDENGDLVAAVADMEIMNEMDSAYISRALEGIDFFPLLIVADGNLSPGAIAAMVEKWKHVRLWFEPTSVPKSVKVADKRVLPHVELISPNADELREIYAALGGDDEIGENIHDIAARVAEKMAQSAAPGGYATRYVLVTLGEEGALVAEASGYCPATVTVFPPPEGKVERMVNCTGAGDCLVGTAAACVLLFPDLHLHRAVELGMHAAKLTIASADAVSKELSTEWISRLHNRINK